MVKDTESNLIVNSLADHQDISSKKEKEEIKPEEFGGPKGLEPTRYNDWERNGRVSDF